MMAFITSTPPLLHARTRRNLSESRLHVCVCSQNSPSHDSAVHQSRRSVLQSLATAALAASLVVVPRGVRPALADRTGKYSTKLTAKRRYIPRIARDLASFAALGTLISSGAAGWETSVSGFLSSEADDAKTAMPLFSTTFFSEGNKIGPTERRLKEIEDDLFGAWAALGRAAKTGKSDQANAAYFAARDSANDYIVTAKLSEVVPLIEK